jgi:hypothetical protein
MRTAILAAAATFAALPALALAQSINPVGMTLPNFQSASLMTVSSQDYTPLKAYDPSAMATRPIPAQKAQVDSAKTHSEAK